MMNLYLNGIDFVYEIEHTVRIFFPKAIIIKNYPSAKKHENCVVIRKTKLYLFCAIRKNGAAAMSKTPIKNANNIGEIIFEDEQKQQSYVFSCLIYKLLCKTENKTPPWGMLTGVRPVSIIHKMKNANNTNEQIKHKFCNIYSANENKFKTALEISNIQKPFIEKSDKLNLPYSLYISIPFCPSRCNYCSFVSRTSGHAQSAIDEYVNKLCVEIEHTACIAQKNNLQICTIYIGGGTPTALSENQLETLLKAVHKNYNLKEVQEFTVEAGRPDCTNYKKLELLKKYGATRISINPQSMSDDVLAAIGRKHSAKDIITCFENARKIGHNNINMDLIAGLFKDDVKGFESSLKQVLKLAPENITVHTLTEKRASNIVIENQIRQYSDVEKMLEISEKLLNENNYLPYYLYRQKATIGNLENIGYAKKGFEGLYNIYIMEEIHSILAVGAGASTKLVNRKTGEIKRFFNHKYHTEYLQNFSEVLKRKQKVSEFYGKQFNLDT